MTSNTESVRRLTVHQNLMAILETRHMRRPERVDRTKNSWSFLAFRVKREYAQAAGTPSTVANTSASRLSRTCARLPSCSRITPVLRTRA